MLSISKYGYGIQKINSNSLHSQLMQHRVKIQKSRQKLPKKFLGMIILHIIKKSTMSLKKAFIIWHCKRNQLKVNLTIDMILTNNQICRQTFFYRLKNLCRNYTLQSTKIKKFNIQQNVNNESKGSISKNNSKISLKLQNQSQINYKNGQQDYQSIVPITNQYFQDSLQTISQEKPITMIEYSVSQTQKKIDFIQQRIDCIRDNYNKLSTRLLARLLRNYQKRIYCFYGNLLIRKIRFS